MSPCSAALIYDVFNWLRYWYNWFGFKKPETELDKFL
jgi:hypothetical protein